MLGNGTAWLDFDGRLIAVNYQSAAEEKKRQAVLLKDRNELHSSLRAFKQPVCVLRIKKFIIRIDDMGNDVYRYASWNDMHKMTEQPDLVIGNGKVIMDGNGGNHSFLFVNNGYEYECMFTVIGDGSEPPAAVTISKNGKVLLHEAATVVAGKG